MRVVTNRPNAEFDPGRLRRNPRIRKQALSTGAELTWQQNRRVNRRPFCFIKNGVSPMQEMPLLRVDICRKLIASRKVVGDCLGYALCPNPIWDMMLELFLAAQEGRPSYLLSLCMFANVPLSTALRKVETMEMSGIIVREAAMRNRRRVEVRFTPHGLETIERALDRLAPIYTAAPDSALFAMRALPFSASIARRN